MNIRCPISGCQAANEALAETCERCGTPLQAYARLMAYPAQLFNLGLTSAKEGKLNRARDHFASVVQWCPKDMEARNALAMACYALNDHEEAGIQWQIVLNDFPANEVALKGTAALALKKSRNPGKGLNPNHNVPGGQRKQNTSKRRR